LVVRNEESQPRAPPSDILPKAKKGVVYPSSGKRKGGVRERFLDRTKRTGRYNLQVAKKKERGKTLYER